jgi:hypothetical protein
VTGPGLSLTVMNSNDAALAAPVTGQLADVGLGCDAADFAGTAGKVAVAIRGVCARTDRATLGQAAGAVAVLLVNDVPGLPPFEGAIPGVDIPFLGVDGLDGVALLEAAAAATPPDVTIDAGADIPNPQYGNTADFTSNGPRRGDSLQKPDLTAPGVSLLSAAAGTGTEGLRLSGTSMSSPHTAGIAALVRQRRPSWSPLQVKSALMSTAQPGRVGDFDSRRNGTGVVNARRATGTVAFASTANGRNSIAFGAEQLADAYAETRSFRITNTSGRSITYDLTRSGSSPGRGASFTITPSVLTVPARSTSTVSVRIALSRLDVRRLPDAFDNDFGFVTSINGVIVATPRQTRAGLFPLRIAYMSVPQGLSDIRATAPTLNAAGNGTLGVRNLGVHRGFADVYAWLDRDPAADVADPEVADIVDLGVQVLPGEAVGAPASDRFLIFAVNTAAGTSTQGSHEFDLFLNTDADPQDDFVVFAVDAGLVLAGSPDGTMGTFVVDLETLEFVPFFFPAFAPMNGSTILMPVLASDVGLSNADGDFDVTGLGATILRPAGVDVTDTVTFDAFHPAVSQGDFVRLPPGTTASIPVSRDAALLANQDVLGWLVSSVDDLAGRPEGARAAL